MASNLNFDHSLLEEAQRLGGHKYKKDTVNAALKEYIERHKQLEVLKLFGTIPYLPKYNYKKARDGRAR
jgi:Bacterial antitoxin of type II TA system, VapB